MEPIAVQAQRYHAVFLVPKKSGRQEGSDQYSWLTWGSITTELLSFSFIKLVLWLGKENVLEKGQKLFMCSFLKMYGLRQAYVFRTLPDQNKTLRLKIKRLLREMWHIHLKADSWVFFEEKNIDSTIHNCWRLTKILKFLYH